MTVFVVREVKSLGLNAFFVLRELIAHQEAMMQGKILKDNQTDYSMTSEEIVEAVNSRVNYHVTNLMQVTAILRILADDGYIAQVR